MSNGQQRVRDLISQEAAGWFVANRADMSHKDRNAFAAWLQASPLHIEEYLRLAAIARDLRQACADSEESINALVVRARNEDAVTESPWARTSATGSEAPARSWRMAAVAMASVTAVAVGLLLFWKLKPMTNPPAPEPVTTVNYATRHGEQLTYSLADRSVLHLNTDSSVTIRYSNTQRIVELKSGEADFEVVHDPARAFRVVSRSAEVVDVGTHFDVRVTDGTTVVTVVEGRIAVRPASNRNGPQAQFVQVAADEQLRVTEGQWPAVPVATDAQRVTAWLHRQISFEHEPLEEVAAEFNRYAAKPIEITTPALRQLQISGVFTSDDTEAFIAFLRSLDGVRVDVTATRIVVSRP